MRGGKDEEQVMSPVFPRFHVNDTEKRGPRAPPRNKMALYELFSIPSQSVTSGSASMLPFLDNDSGSWVPSTSRNDVSIHGGNIFTPACNSVVVHSFSAEKIQSCTPSGAELNTMADCERISTKPSNYLTPTGPSSSTAKCDSFQPKSPFNFRNFSLNKFGSEDCLGVPTTFEGTALPCRNSQQSKESEKFSCLSSTMQLKSSCSKQLKASDLNSRQCGRSHDEESPKVSQVDNDPMERSVSLAIATAKDFANASSRPSNTVKNSELKRKHAFTSQEDKSSENGLNRLHRESMTVAVREGILLQPGTGTVISSKVGGKSCLTRTLGNDNEICDRVENDSEFREETYGVVRVGDLSEHDDVSDMSTGVSPDDVIGVISAKQFFETRKVIVNQQRVFAVQVFELHRLIKVQRLIAGSPNLLLEGNHFLSKPAVKVPPPVKKVPLKHALEPPLLILKPKDHYQKRNSSGECAEESAVVKFPLPFVNNGITGRGHVTHQSNDDQHSNTAPSASGTTNSKPALWCLQPPPGNMWFVPVMSSSEGLAYQPYTGQCHPTGSFMAPMYGSYGPPSFNLGTRDYFNAGYGVPYPNQHGLGIGTPPFVQSYCPPYGLPIINPSFPSSSGGLSNGQENHTSFGEINFTLAHVSSCNMSCQMRQATPCPGTDIQASERSELQARASSSSHRTTQNVLPLFPVAPQLEELGQNAQTSELQTRPIKVIPHNTKSASSESAARIFLSIREERK